MTSALCLALSFVLAGQGASPIQPPAGRPTPPKQTAPNQPAPKPPATPPATTPKLPGAPAPATPPAESRPEALPAPAPPDGVMWMDPKPLTPTIDSMRDIQPATGVLANCAGVVTAAEPDLGIPAGYLTWKSDGDRVQLICQGVEDRKAVLGQLRWKGARIEWEWMRASVGSFPQALIEIQRMLRWMTVKVTMQGGATVTLMAPPSVVRASISQQVPAIINMPANTGRQLSPYIAEFPNWTMEPASSGGTRLTCSIGSIRVSMDEHGRLRAEVEPQGGMVVAELRKQVAEKKRELPRVSPEERRIVTAEIEDLEDRILAAERENRKPIGPWPAFPVVRVRDANGREFLVAEMQVKTS